MILVSGLLTPFIAVLAVLIAYQQWRVQHDKLRLDLFDRRAKVFEALTALLYAVLRDGKATRQHLLEFGAGTANASFLFDRDIGDYLKQVNSKAVEQMQLSERLYAHAYDPEFEERQRLAENESALLIWLSNQVEESRKQFDPYLGFAKVRSSSTALPKVTFRRAQVPWTAFWMDLTLVFTAFALPLAFYIVDRNAGCHNWFARAGALTVLISGYLGYRSLSKHYIKFAANTERGFALLTSTSQRMIDIATLVAGVAGTLVWAYGDNAFKVVCSAT